VNSQGELQSISKSSFARVVDSHAKVLKRKKHISSVKKY